MATPPPRKKPKAKTACRPKTPPTPRGFIHVNEAVASRAEPYKLPHDSATIYTDQLFLDDSQREAVLHIYAGDQQFCQTFDTGNKHGQLTAHAILAANHLDNGALDNFGSKWSCRWSSSEGAGEKVTQRLLYQCSSKCSNPVNFTGCLVHCEIVYQVNSHQIIAICGHLEHNDKCLTSAFTRPPVFPTGVTLADVKKMNQQMFAEHQYMGMPQDLANSQYWWLLSHKDNRSLYQQFHCLQGIKISEKDHINLHEWLDTDSPQFVRPFTMPYITIRRELLRESILKSVLERWRLSLGRRDGEDFNVWVAITDTDLTERRALLQVFPHIVLLICKFHLRQSWKNHRNRSLKGTSTNHCNLKCCLCQVEHLLLETEDFMSAKSIVTEEKRVILVLQGAGECNKGASAGAVEHLDYLDSYWLRKALWWRLEDSESAWQDALLRKLPGGVMILDLCSHSFLPSVLAVYWANTNERDVGAAALVGNCHIGVPTLNNEGAYTFECFLALATEFDLSPIKYTIVFHLAGMPRAQALPIEAAAPPIFVLDPVTQALIAINDFLCEGADSKNPQLGSEQLEGHDSNAIGRRITDELTLDDTSDLAGSEHSGFVTPGPDNDNADNANDDTLSARGPRPNLDFKELQQTNQQALNKQTISRTLHDLEKMAPRLDQMAEWLCNAHLAQHLSADIFRAKKVQSVLNRLTCQLDR
ncbi:hypothetical protein BC835DRAFT_1310649 [Cytidiella melzeri]|nr:hypothetical protein BC835DRAFT_1310649 [Cytidiella melzeri]